MWKFICGRSRRLCQWSRAWDFQSSTQVYLKREIPVCLFIPYWAVHVHPFCTGFCLKVSPASNTQDTFSEDHGCMIWCLPTGQARGCWHMFTRGLQLHVLNGKNQNVRTFHLDRFHILWVSYALFFLFQMRCAKVREMKRSADVMRVSISK